MWRLQNPQSAQTFFPNLRVDPISLFCFSYAELDLTYSTRLKIFMVALFDGYEWKKEVHMLQGFVPIVKLADNQIFFGTHYTFLKKMNLTAGPTHYFLTCTSAFCKKGCETFSHLWMCENGL